MLNILMPLAGAGRRFRDAGYAEPKPLIEIDGIPMWETVWCNVLPGRHENRLIVVAQDDFLSKAQIINVTPVRAEALTEGAACTVLLAEHLIDNYDPLLIVNGDQVIEGLDIDAFLDFAKDYHGCIMTFDVGPDEPPKWSYVRREIGESCPGDDEHRIWWVAEKDPISNEATCGLYWFRHGRDFLRAAHAMITKGIRTNGEFYLCPVYEEFISEGLSVGAWKVEDHGATMHGIGTPSDLEKFLAHRRPAERADSNVA